MITKDDDGLTILVVGQKRPDFVSKYNYPLMLKKKHFAERGVVD